MQSPVISKHLTVHRQLEIEGDVSSSALPPAVVFWQTDRGQTKPPPCSSQLLIPGGREYDVRVRALACLLASQILRLTFYSCFKFCLKEKFFDILCLQLQKRVPLVIECICVEPEGS